MRRPHGAMFGHLNRRAGKFFRANNARGGRHARGHCQPPYLLFLLFKALKATKLTLSCAARPSMCPRRMRASVIPDLMLRAGVSSLKWSPGSSDLGQFRFSSLYGQRLVPGCSPYEMLKQSVLLNNNISESDLALQRFQDQFRSRRAIGAEIREKLRGLAVYQQAISNFLFPLAPAEPAEPAPAPAPSSSVLSAFTSIKSGNANTSASASVSTGAGVSARQAAPPRQEQFEHLELSDYTFPETSVVSAAVDFNLTPRLGLPVVGELNDDMLGAVRTAISSQIANLRAVLADVDRIAELGELPVSIEQNGTVLRVHLPNCDADRANVLVDEKEVTHGRTVEIVAPRIQVPGTDPLSSAASSEFDVQTESGSEASDEVWQHVRDDTPGLTSMESSQSHSSPSLLTLN